MGVDLVARAEELEALEGFLSGPPAGGPAVLVLEGEAGIGKSTLWRAGVEAAREHGMRVLSSRPAEVESGVAHAGLGDLLEDSLGDVLPNLAPPRRRALEIALLVDGDEHEPVDFRTLAVAVRTALQLLAADEPVVVAIDDVQWLDSSSSSALAFALRRLDDVNIRILLARRLGENGGVSELEAAVDDSRIERLHVGPLSPGAVHAILQRRLGRSFGRPTLLRLHEASGGNAFFALELARAVDAEGGSGDPTRMLPLPDVLAQLVQARLAELPEQTRAALLLVAAGGKSTRATLRAAKIDDRALEPAVASGVTAVAADDVTFTHPLLASALYHGADAGERQRAHRVLAEVVDDPVARARHLALAAEGPAASTAAVLDDAAAVALARGAPMVAAELCEHALRATPADAHEDRHRRSLAAARAHLAAGEEVRARTMAEKLLAEADAGPSRAEALALVAELEKYDRRVALLVDAVREARTSPALQARLHHTLAAVGRFTRGLTWAEGHARAALRLADELDDDTLRVGALSVLALLRFGLGDPTAPGLAERAYALASESGDREQLQEASWVLAHVLMWSVETHRARALLEARCEEEQHRDERGTGESFWYLSFVEFRAGRWDVAADHAERSLDLGTQYGTLFPQLLFPVALIAAHRGELERAAELTAEARVLAEDGRALLGGLVGLAALIELWSGDAAAALVLFSRAEEHADAAEWGEPNLRWWRADYVEALLEVGRTDDAAVVLDEWEESSARVGRAWTLVQAKRCRGLLAAAKGYVETALSTLEDAVVEHAEVGDPFGRARALLALGVTRRRARQKRPAREAIEAAVAEFEALGAAGWAAKARAELGRIGGRTQAEGLTPAERRVAALVAEGRTNREVAAALFLAERTVASHLSHVYGKLGVRSRTELARKLPTF